MPRYYFQDKPPKTISGVDDPVCTEHEAGGSAENLRISGISADEDLRRALEEEKEQCRELKDHCKELEAVIALQYMQIKKLTEEKTKAKNRTTKLQDAAVTAQNELQICKAELFRLQPIAKVTDSDIRSEYENLCEQIRSWVDEQLFYFECKSNNSLGQADAVVGGDDLESRNFLQRAPGADEYLLNATIHWKLQKHFFGPDVVLFGLSKDFTAILKAIRQKMEGFRPKRGIHLRPSYFKSDFL